MLKCNFLKSDMFDPSSVTDLTELYNIHLELSSYVQANHLNNPDVRNRMKEKEPVLFTRLSVFYEWWNHLILESVLQMNSPYLGRFTTYAMSSNYLSKLNSCFNIHKHMSYEQMSKLIIRAFKRVTESYDNGEFRFRYDSMISLNNKTGYPEALYVYDKFDRAIFENSLRNVRLE